MNHRRFGSTDLVVSEVGFGCARLGGVFGEATSGEMLNTLRRAFDHGVTFFDTADMYTQGESESLLGRAFHADRGAVVIASKAGYRLPAQRQLAARVKPLLRPLIRRVGLKRGHLPGDLRGALSQDFAPAYLIRAVEGSLRRLRTSYLDLVQLHSPPAAVLRSGDFLEPLERLKAQGKIRYHGVSCETAEDALICLRYPQISSLQIRLSLLDQRALAEAIPRAAAMGMGIIARECFAGGLLVGPRDTPPASPACEDGTEHESEARAVGHYRRIAAQLGRPLPELALQFVLSQDQVSVVLLGMRTDAHLADNLRHLAAAPLTVEDVRRVRAGDPAAIAAAGHGQDRTEQIATA